MEAATVYLSKTKDATLIEYTISDKNGFFDLKVRKTNEETVLKISNLGYDDFKKTIPSLTSDMNFETIQIIESAQLLNEIVITSETPPIRIKKDTLEFNVASFKVRPDANVETLLKQLPGVEIDSEGKITVNGKEVNQVLVNGKPFFDKDGKIALQSLPADMINKVQVSDTKTKKEEITGQESSSNNASINLTIDKNKEKGLFGKFLTGYGTNGYYEAGALVNYFKGKRKISVLASSNNINSMGFSMDDVFDNMGGGRNNTAFGAEMMRSGIGKGIIQSNMMGFNYDDEPIKDFETNGSYFFTNSNTKNNNKTKTENLLPTGKFNTESNVITEEDRLANTVKAELEYKIDSTMTLTITPKLIKAENKIKNEANESSKDENNQLLNESVSKTSSENNSNNLSNSINFNKAFAKKGRNLNMSFGNDNYNEIATDLSTSKTVFYESTRPDDIRNQMKRNRNLKDNYNAEIEYNEPIKDSIFINLSVAFNWLKTSDERNTFDFNSLSQEYDVRNDSLTNFLTSTKNAIAPKAGFSIRKKKYNFNFSAGTTITQFDNSSLYIGNVTRLDKSYALPDVKANFNYRFSKSKSLWTSYNYIVNVPSANQMMSVVNLANPLNTYIGNPNLNPTKKHNFNLSFRDFKTATKTGYSFLLGGDFHESQIVSSSEYDANRKRTTTYQNISGAYATWVGFSWNQTLKNGAHTFKFGFGLNENFSLSKGLTNKQEYQAQSFRVTPRTNFTYEYGELLTINPSYNLSYNDTKYTNYSQKSAASVSHKFNLQTTNYWPKNWVFGNDFGYTYNSRIADGFKKDFYLWNTSLSYSFLDKKMMAKVKVYDVLNQNQSAVRTISATTIRDEENTVLKRYMMFSLTYKLGKFAEKKKPSRSRAGM